jgi:lipopolysaccharide export system ATP-binding protein
MANELDDRAHKHTHTLAARGLKKNYGSRQVVKGVDLSVKSGEVVGLLGPNGAGKTTTFYMVVGLVVADGGDIELDGRSIARLPIYKRARLGVSYLPQEASVFRKLSVEDNIRAILEMQVDENGRALDTSEIEHRLEMLLDELQIKHLRTNAALSLSGGERRRTEIARALAANPRFILLDEPFADVDLEPFTQPPVDQKEQPDVSFWRSDLIPAITAVATVGLAYLAGFYYGRNYAPQS